MQHFLGEKPDDRMSHDKWIASIADSLRRSIKAYMRDCGWDYATTREHVKQSSTAGIAVWKILDDEFTA